MPVTLPLDALLSSTDPADFSARRQLSDVSTVIAKSKKVVVVSGAGISCSSGIPDFRSDGGLYSLVKAKYPDAFFTGRDLFSAGTFANPLTTSIFYTFIAELSLSCTAAHPTRTHHFIRKLEQKGKLLRSYTQNVDGLERRIGLESGGRGKGLKKKGTRNVELHGDLGRVRCVLCHADYEATREVMQMFREGEAPECQSCLQRCESRLSRSARATPVGTLRPSIVLYDEPHPLGDDIGALTSYDLSRQPDVLLIMGTSLKVHGLKRLVKEFAKSVHGGAKRGLVVFVNATPPSKEWDGVIDVHIQGETDRWVERVEEEWRRVKPGDWEVQTRLDGEMVQVVKPVRPKAKGKGLSVKDTNKGLPPSPPMTASPSSSGFPSSQISLPSTDSQDSQPAPASSSSSASTLTPAPPTPLSPSKRASNAQAHDSPTKKSKGFEVVIPVTGLPGTPGKGNLFVSPTKGKASSAAVMAVVDDEWEDAEDVFSLAKNSNQKQAAAAAPLGKGKSVAAGRGKGAAATKGKGKASSDGKENHPVEAVKAPRSRTVKAPRARTTAAAAAAAAACPRGVVKRRGVAVEV